MRAYRVEPRLRLPSEARRARQGKRARDRTVALGPAVSALRSSTSLGRVLDFMRLLWAVDHGLTRISRRMERTLGVTGPQRMVVRLVGHQPGISAGDLARTLHVHPSTLTEVLRRLTERGILERTRDPSDARRALFRLTRRGLQLDALRRGTGESRVRVALGSLSDEDLAAAGRVLGRLAQALSDEAVA
jgi:MarR family transcriptional regulator, organic hydroperoxide resistance regulator